MLSRSDTVGYMLHVGFIQFIYSQLLSTGILAPDFFCVSFAEGLLAPETGASHPKSSVEQVTSGSLQSNQSHNGLKKCQQPKLPNHHVLCEAEFKPTAQASNTSTRTGTVCTNGAPPDAAPSATVAPVTGGKRASCTRIRHSNSTK